MGLKFIQQGWVHEVVLPCKGSLSLKKKKEFETIFFFTNFFFSLFSHA